MTQKINTLIFDSKYYNITNKFIYMELQVLVKHSMYKSFWKVTISLDTAQNLTGK